MSWGPGRIDVLAFGTDYRPFHWWWSGTNGPYSWSARAVTMQPPDYLPRTVEVAQQLWPRVTRVVNEDEILLSEPLSRMESELALAPFRLDLSSSRLLLSLVFSR